MARNKMVRISFEASWTRDWSAANTMYPTSVYENFILYRRWTECQTATYLVITFSNHKLPTLSCNKNFTKRKHIIPSSPAICLPSSWCKAFIALHLSCVLASCRGISDDVLTVFIRPHLVLNCSLAFCKVQACPLFYNVFPSIPEVACHSVSSPTL